MGTVAEFAGIVCEVANETMNKNARSAGADFMGEL